LKGDFANAKAVWNARREFFRIRSQFTADRQQNLAHTVLKTIPERYSFSLVWQAKVKGRKTFSALSH
jgi:hypothetical protein